MYSVQIAVSDGTLTRISLSIEYFEKDDITLYRNLELTPLVLGTDWQWDGNTAINLLTNTPVPLGSYITVRRNTNIDRAFNIYDGGAAFSRDTLDENFKQMIYLAQEFTEGNGLTGLFFPLDMHGFQIKNLGTPTDPKDAVTKEYVDDYNAIQDNTFANGQAAQDAAFANGQAAQDQAVAASQAAQDAAVAASQAVQDNRLASLESTFVQVTASYPWFTTTTTETDTLSPGLVFNKAALYLNGTRQTPDESYIVVDNQIVLATTIPVGTVVLAALGEDIDNPDGFATTTQAVNLQTQVTALSQKVRKKMEVYYSGLTLSIPTTATNFIDLVKALTPTSGALNSFFNTTSNKLNVYNDNTSVFFKVNIVGSWTTTSQNRSMVLDFAGTQGNRLTVNRVDNTVPDTVQFSTHFSVDANGNMVTNGTAPSIQSNGSVFTATAILITVEQTTGVASITPV